MRKFPPIKTLDGLEAEGRQKSCFRRNFKSL
jgi:hypothetical protein